MAHACNPSILGGQGGWTIRSVWNKPGQHGETPSLLKIQKYPGVGAGSVIPATQEAEAKELLESIRWSLRWAEIGWQSKTPSLREKKKKEKQRNQLQLNKRICYCPEFGNCFICGFSSYLGAMGNYSWAPQNRKAFLRICAQSKCLQLNIDS